MIANHNKVLPSVWRKWSEAQRYAFNLLYDHYYENQGLLEHIPTKTMPSIKPRAWKTLAWNAAWEGADLLCRKYHYSVDSTL